MTFTMTVKMDSDVFATLPEAELARILRSAAMAVEQDGVCDGQTWGVRDINGNAVGTAKVEP